MSMEKSKIFAHWQRVRDKVKAATAANDAGLAAFYTKISSRIEKRFFRIFGESLGAFAVACLEN